MSSAIDDERVGWPRNALDRLLGLLDDLSWATKILKLGGVKISSARELSPCPTRRQTEVGNQRVSSSAKSVDVAQHIVLLEDRDGADEVLLESAQ